MLTVLFPLLITFAWASEFETLKNCLDSKYSKLEGHRAFVAAAVSEDQEAILTFGKATQDKIFEIGSLTKTMTGNLLAMAIQEGKVKLNDPVPEHWQKGQGNINYAHLATHTSGLPSNLASYWDIKNPSWPYEGLTKEVFKRIYPTMPMDFAVGEKYKYSNSGMTTLGLILEELYGKSYEQLVQEKIFAPLKMQDSYFELPKKESHRLTAGWVNNEPWPNWNIYKTAFNPAGGVRSTIGDMVKYVRGNLEGPVAELAQTPIYPRGKVANAMGWVTNPKRGTAFHDGSTIAYNSILVISMKHKLGVIALTDSGFYGKDGYDFSFNNIAFECIQLLGSDEKVHR